MGVFLRHRVIFVLHYIDDNMNDNDNIDGDSADNDDDDNDHDIIISLSVCASSSPLDDNLVRSSCMYNTNSA